MLLIRSKVTGTVPEHKSYPLLVVTFLIPIVAAVWFLGFLVATAPVSPDRPQRGTQDDLPLLPNIPEVVEVGLVLAVGLAFLTLALYLRHFVERREHRPQR
jgi:hypothetical protein